MSKEEFEYVRGEEKDHGDVLEFLCQHFLIEETMNVALHLTKEEFVPLVFDLISECLSSGFTILARNKKTNQIVGLVLNNIWRRDTSHEEAKLRPENPSPAQVIELFLTTFADAFWRLVPPNVDAVLHREILSVGIPWQRKGIGSHLIEEGYTLSSLKEKGIQAFASKTSSLANQKLMERKGYSELMSIPFSSVLDVDGRPLVVPLDGTTRNVLLWKLID